MVYIPEEWIKDKNNMPKIIEIFEYLAQDVLTDEIINKQNLYIEKLKAMGEDILYEKIKNREIPIN